jgi:predicted  nucleic acid-binding Zn-ribbon protein
MSDSVRPEVTAFLELETLVRHLGDELAGFRRRALTAEARVRELEAKGGQPALKQRELADRCTALERENAALRDRLDAATARARQMLDRVRFIRQQTQLGAGGER